MTARKTGLFVGAVAGVGVAAAALAGVGLRMPANAADQPGFIRASTAPMFAPPPGAPMSFADIFERVSPAVVQIDVTSKADVSALRKIPGLEGLPQGAVPDGSGRTPKQQSSGSGFFISADGFIVTNNHVVEGAETINVVMKDGRELKGTVVGRDESTDLAVVKVEGKDFPYVNFENSAKPRVGDWVITIGNPFGLGGTATAGIISAYGRDIGDTAFVDYIQIDAPINRGNSGGPTFDTYGRVIGVNSAIFSPSGGSVGIGFAIPADIADNITKQLIHGGKITRGYIGATIQNFTTDMADARGMAGQKGAIVTDLAPGGPASKAGLAPGDVVTTVNGVKVTTSSELTRQVARAAPGDTLHLDVIRDEAHRTVDIKSGTRPAEKSLASAGGDNDDGDQGGATPDKPATPKAVVLGLSVIPIDPAARQRFQLPDEVHGIVIDGLQGDSDAADKGLARGDAITSINNKPVNTPAEAMAIIDAAKKAGRAQVLLGFVHAGRSGFLPVKITP
jgi:serine protease Do